MQNNYSSTISTDSIAIVEAIKAMATTLTERVSKTESDFISHLQKVEARLDQLVELTKSVAIIQTQASSQAEQMTELRTQMRMMQEKADTSISRLHTRIDEAITQINLKMEVKERDCEKHIKDVDEGHKKLSEEFHYYLNRVLGAWALFSFLIVGMGWVGNKTIESIERDKNDLVTSVRTLRENTGTNDVRMTQVINKLQEHLDEHAGKRR